MNRTLKIAILSFLLFSINSGINAAAAYVYAQEAATQEAREHFASGKKLMQEGNYSAADEEFKKAQEILKSSSGPDLVSGLDAPEANQETGAGKIKKMTKERYQIGRAHV